MKKLRKHKIISICLLTIFLALFSACSGSDSSDGDSSGGGEKPKTTNPIFAPYSATGYEFSGTLEITLIPTTPDSVILYTSDGSDPSLYNGSLYYEEFEISESKTIKAIAIKNNYDNSDIVTATYIRTSQDQVAKPSFSPYNPDNSNEHCFSNSVTVTITTSTSGASIRYTTDNSVPTQYNGTLINSGGNVTLTDTATLKAIAFKSGMTDSEIMTGKYVKTSTSPEIEVDSYANNSEYDFGTLDSGNSKSKTFTIRNTGTDDLIISQDIQVTGSGFSFSGSQPSKTISPNSYETFTVIFEASGSGDKAGTVVIKSNDTDEATYTINLKAKVTGTTLEPEIEVENYAINSQYDFGTLDSGTSANKTFTIKNTGTADLELTSDVAVTGDGFSFSGSQPSKTIAPNSSETFTVAFSASGSGDKTGTIVIKNNDDNEGTYLISLKAYVSASTEDGTLKIKFVNWGESNTVYFPGDFNDWSFPDTFSGNGTLTKKAVITTTNLAKGDDANKLEFKVCNNSNWSDIWTFNSWRLGDGVSLVDGSQQIGLECTAGKDATVTFDFSDMSISLDANIEPSPDLEVTNYTNGSTYDFGTVSSGSSQEETFTLKNVGEKELILSGDITVSGSGFSFSGSQPAKTISAGSSENFKVKFTASSTESQTGTITITSNDPNDSSYIINVKANSSSQSDLPEKVEDGVMLHCLEWKFNDIKTNLSKIAEQGFNSIQVSPVTPHRTDISQWYRLYQPTDFTIGNSMGSKSDFESLCSEAEKVGIKIIVDAVLQHVATSDDACSQIHAQVADYLKNNSDYFHWNGCIPQSAYSCDTPDRWQITQAGVGLVDMNTQHSDVQKIHLDFLNACVDAGADGFRYDTAKHIETDSGGWWDNVSDKVKNRSSLYMVGEVLPSGGDDVNSYLSHVDVTAHNYGGTLRNAVWNKNTNGLWRVNWGCTRDWIPNENALAYVENHDDRLNSGNPTSGWNNTDERIMANLLLIPRAGLVPRIYDRSETDIWKDDRIAAANKFRNAVVGTEEYLYYPNNNQALVIDRRSTSSLSKGVAIINLGGSFSINCETALPDGSYTSQGGASCTLTVSGGKITGNVPGWSGVFLINK